MVYVQRYASGAIQGVFANRQDGYAEEMLDDSDPQVVAFLTPAPLVPAVTQRQARLALLRAGLLDQVNAAVAAAGGEAKITWDYADVIHRNDALLVTLGASLGLSPAQIDVLFATASTL